MRPSPDVFQHILTTLLAHAFPEEPGVILHTRCSGRLFFNLSRLWAKSKTKRILICRLLCAGDPAPVAHSEMLLQNMCESFAKACTDFCMTISLKKTIAMSLGIPNPLRILINGSLPKNDDKLSHLASAVNFSKSLDANSTNELERLRPTSGNSVFGLVTITTSLSN